MQIFAPFGLKPVTNQVGSTSNIVSNQFGALQSGGANALYTFQPITIDANGFVQPAFTTGTPNVAAPIEGVFMGAEYCSADNGAWKQRPSVPAGTLLYNNAVAGVNNGDVQNSYGNPKIITDSTTIFAIQANGYVTKSAVGQYANCVINNGAAIGGVTKYSVVDGNPSSGLSTVSLDSKSIAAVKGSLTLKIVGLARNEAPGQQNQWSTTSTTGDPYPILLVQLVASPLNSVV